MSKQQTIASLMIGRGGSSLKGKNILPVHGIPLLCWGASAARRSKHIGRYYISSDDTDILNTAASAGYTKILRPDELCTDTAQSSDAVRHAMKIIESESPVDILVVQHANVGTITAEMIDNCIELLLERHELSSVIPSHEMSEYHPYRAKGLNTDGTLRPFVEGSGKASANRQDLPKCLFFDHSFWVLRKSAVWDEEGQGPWPVMGKKILPYITEGCLDVHSMEDILKTERWIDEHKVPPPVN